jgi:Mg-chelatase subunit ChlD
MPSTPTLTLTPTAEMMALSFASTHKPLAMVSLVAPALTVDRLPVDVVAVVDCSGSMHGDKMEQMKATMRLLVQSLTSSDKLSIVAFDSDVRTPLALTAQNASGTKRLRSLRSPSSPLAARQTSQAAYCAGLMSC